MAGLHAETAPGPARPMRSQVSSHPIPSPPRQRPLRAVEPQVLVLLPPGGQKTKETPAATGAGPAYPMGSQALSHAVPSTAQSGPHRRLPRASFPLPRQRSEGKTRPEKPPEGPPLDAAVRSRQQHWANPPMDSHRASHCHGIDPERPGLDGPSVPKTPWEIMGAAGTGSLAGRRSASPIYRERSASI